MVRWVGLHQRKRSLFLYHLLYGIQCVIAFDYKVVGLKSESVVPLKNGNVDAKYFS